MRLASGSILVAAVRTGMARDRSRVLRTYAILAALLSLFVAVLLLLALPGWVAQTDGSTATLMLSPAVLLLGGIGVIAGLMLPLLRVRKRLPEAGERSQQEAIYGAVGYAFVLALYVGLLISAPAEYVEETSSIVQPAVDALNALNPVLGLVPPMAIIGLLALVDRRFSD